MPRKPDMPCTMCGKLMWRGTTSARRPICLPCRRAAAVHGTKARYDKGCRCDKCRDAIRTRMAEYAARRASEGRPLDYRARQQTETDCEHCHRKFTAEKGKRRRFCSLTCANDAQGRRPPRKSAFRKRAERLAARAAAGSSGGKRVWVQGPCAICGEPFMSPGAASRYCSPECRDKNRQRAWGLTWLDRMALYERDGWMCQICGEPTDYTSDPLSDWYPSLDHITPRAAGGTDDPTNLRTAHRWCNSVRGDLTYYTDAELNPRAHTQAA